MFKIPVQSPSVEFFWIMKTSRPLNQSDSSESEEFCIWAVQKDEASIAVYWTLTGSYFRFSSPGFWGQHSLIMLQ